jgi:site-specific recombinase XerD
LKWVHKSFERLMVQAGLPKITPHSLRRNFVLHALDSGASIYAVSKLLGHASVETTTKRYASMSNPALFEAANGASKFLQGRLRPPPQKP